MDAQTVQTWCEQRGHPGLIGSLQCADRGESTVLDWLDHHATPRTKERLQNRDTLLSLKPMETIERGEAMSVADLQPSRSFDPVERRKALVFYQGSVLTIQRKSLTQEIYHTVALSGLVGSVLGGLGGIIATTAWTGHDPGATLNEVVQHIESFQGLLPTMGLAGGVLGMLIFMLFTYLFYRPSDDPHITTVHDGPKTILQTLDEADGNETSPEGMQRLLSWFQRNGATKLVDTDTTVVLEVAGRYVLYDRQNHNVRCFDNERFLRGTVQHEYSSQVYATLDATL